MPYPALSPIATTFTAVLPCAALGPIATTVGVIFTLALEIVTFETHVSVIFWEADISTFPPRAVNCSVVSDLIGKVLVECSDLPTISISALIERFTAVPVISIFVPAVGGVAAAHTNPPPPVPAVKI